MSHPHHLPRSGYLCEFSVWCADSRCVGACLCELRLLALRCQCVCNAIQLASISALVVLARLFHQTSIDLCNCRNGNLRQAALDRLGRFRTHDVPPHLIGSTLGGGVARIRAALLANDRSRPNVRRGRNIVLVSAYSFRGNLGSWPC